MEGLERARNPSKRTGHSSIGRSLSRSSWNMEDVFSAGSRRSSRVDDDEEALKWAAIEKLPTYDRLRTSIMQSFVDQEIIGNKVEHRAVDVRNLDMNDRQKFIDMLFKVAEEDNEKFLRKFRNRIDKVGIQLPTVEVRYQNLTIEADCYIGSRALPTLPNTALNLIESAVGLFGIRFAKQTNLTILKDASGIIKPSRMTLLLGPPSSGKTTLLLALADKLDKSLRVKGEITYNGHKLNEFVARKTSAYISQNDVHVGEMTVKETFDFSARCQGVGTRYDLLSELARREKDAGILPEADVDLFMKATSVHGVESSLITDYTLKILGLDICKDIIVGDDMHRGISGGQKKRVTTERKGTADFLQEVTSKKDQEQYWADKRKPYRYITVPEFASRLPVFYKQRDLLFHPVWTFTLPTFLLRVPISILETTAWMVVTYYTIGYAPAASRFFKTFLLVFLIQQMAAGLFRLIASLCRSMMIANTGGTLTLLLVFMLGGFIVPKNQIPSWWEWAYWVSPLTYGFNGFSVNEMLASRWINKPASDGSPNLSAQVLRTFDIPNDKNWYWIGAGALMGFTVLFNVLFTFALMYLNPLGKPQAVISEETAQELEGEHVASNEEPRLMRPQSSKNSFSAGASNEQEMAIRRMSNRANSRGMDRNDSSIDVATGVAPKRGMVLPFTPLAMSFDNVDYYVDMPPEMRAQGVGDDRESLIYSAFLRLPKEISNEEKMTFVDEVMRGGQVIYAGPLGRNSQKIIEYFESIHGVPRIKDKYNPATWMLEVSSIAAEARLGIDFAEHYKSSSLFQRNKALVNELSTPPPGATDLYFATQYFFTLVAALLVGSIFWQVGTKRSTSTDLSMIIGAMYAAVIFVGINNCSTVQPVIAIERTVFYRERAAGMYSALPYALSQVFCEIPYIFFQTTYYTLIVYAMVGFQWTAAKFFWFFFVNFFTYLYFTYYGMMVVSITPNHQVAAIFASAFYSVFNLFSGFFIARPSIPGWWIWYYWICPVAWTIYGLIVSQYGDMDDPLTVPGNPRNYTIKSYIDDRYGFKSDFMGPISGVLVAFAAFFAFMFAYCIRTLNFQNR
ncbi:hypothetical protein V6N13_015885 [Hibiscus sabdariffa]